MSTESDEQPELENQERLTLSVVNKMFIIFLQSKNISKCQYHLQLHLKICLKKIKVKIFTSKLVIIMKKTNILAKITSQEKIILENLAKNILATKKILAKNLLTTKILMENTNPTRKKLTKRKIFHKNKIYQNFLLKNA